MDYEELFLALREGNFDGGSQEIDQGDESPENTFDLYVFREVRTIFKEDPQTDMRAFFARGTQVLRIAQEKLQNLIEVFEEIRANQANSQDEAGRGEYQGS